MEWQDYCKEENWHPLACLAPLMPEERLKALAENIKEHGLQEPVVLFEGQVLDGRNRLLACVHAGREPKFTEFEENGLSPLEFVITKNIRREMTPSQRAAWAAKLVPELRKEAEKRTGGRPRKDDVLNVPPESSGKSAELAARKVGVSATYVEKALAFEATQPGILDLIVRGKLTLSQAEKELSTGRAGTLSKKWVIPPFSTMDPSQEYWKKRKHEWTTVFDPVLTECMVRWFAPGEEKGFGHILDPFSNGSSRGLVATYLGYRYTGVEWNTGMAETNRRQAKSMQITNPSMDIPNWIEGTGEVLKLPAGENYDLIFTSAPCYYGDKEDRSRWGTYEKFLEWYEIICGQAAARLKHNRFLVVAVEELLDNKGSIRGFVEYNQTIFGKLGMYSYNRFILENSRKELPYVAQVVCFWNGDRDKLAIPEALGDIQPASEHLVP
jgi:ParB-like nuclease family protein